MCQYGPVIFDSKWKKAPFIVTINHIKKRNKANQKRILLLSLPLVWKINLSKKIKTTIHIAGI